jgi:hypothetical protein
MFTHSGVHIVLHVRGKFEKRKEDEKTHDYTIDFTIIYVWE